MIFKTVKDLFKKFGGLRWSVKMPTDPESGCICDQVGLRKKFSIRCQFSSSTPLFIVFQHKLFFNLVKDLVK